MFGYGADLDGGGERGKKNMNVKVKGNDGAKDKNLLEEIFKCCTSSIKVIRLKRSIIWKRMGKEKLDYFKDN